MGPFVGSAARMVRGLTIAIVAMSVAGIAFADDAVVDRSSSSRKLQALPRGRGAKPVVTIYEFHEPMRVGQPPAPGQPAAPGSTLGVDTVVGGALPHYFLVKVVQDTVDGPLLERNLQVARAIIDQEKPAHTYYDLIFESPTMQIGVHSTVGVDTLLGTRG